MNINTHNSPHTYAYDDRVAHASTSNTGKNPVENISVIPPSAVEARCSAHPSLQDMPDELLLNIFSRLSCIENIVVKSTFEAANRVVNDILSRESARWFSRFSPQQQAKFKKIAEGTDKQILRTWVEQFTKEDKEEEVVKHLMDNRHLRHYPELLFYTFSQLMADCQAFKTELVASIEHNHVVIATTFSDDGNHMVTRSCSDQSKICSLGPGGNWMEKTTISNEFIPLSPGYRFSDDGKHLKIRYLCFPSEIYALNSDGNWVLENNLPQDRHINYTEFSPDGLHKAIIDTTNTLRILGQGMDGAWAEEKKGMFSDRVYFAPPEFNRNSNELVAVSKDGELLIYRRGSDGCWTEKAIFPNQPDSYHWQVSPNDSYMITFHRFAEIAKILGRGTDGDWMEQTVINHQALSADFSPDSRYLLIKCRNTVAIYYLDINGSWIEKTTLDRIPNGATAAFSFDGRFLLIPANDDTVKLYGLGADGQCTETTRIDRATGAFFSYDGNHIFTYYHKHKHKHKHKRTPYYDNRKRTVYYQNNKLTTYYHKHKRTFDDNPEISDGNLRLLTIYGLNQDGKLKLKTIIDHGQRIHSAAISPTGRYLVTHGYDKKAKIWALCSFCRKPTRCPRACPDIPDVVALARDFSNSVKLKNGIKVHGQRCKFSTRKACASKTNRGFPDQKQKK